MKILYGICGEGNGHTFRSKAVIDELANKHTLQIVAGKNAHNYFKQKYPAQKVESLFVNYSNNQVQTLKTILLNIAKLPKYIKSFYQVCRIFDKFNPDIVITDLEIFSAYASLLKRKPLISIDNHQVLVKTKIKLSWPRFLSFINVFLVVKFFVPKAKHYFITTFFPAEKKKSNVTLIPPILRKEITCLKTTKKDFYLVYQTSKTNRKLVEILKTVQEKFFIYGFDVEKKQGNLYFRKNNENDFFEHLAGCKGVITNGGLTLITEAIYLGKPILSLPIKGQFEQELNALNVEKFDFGMQSSKTTMQVIQQFILFSKKFKPKQEPQSAGQEFFGQLEEKMEELC